MDKVANLLGTLWWVLELRKSLPSRTDVGAIRRTSFMEWRHGWGRPNGHRCGGPPRTFIYHSWSDAGCERWDQKIDRFYCSILQSSLEEEPFNFPHHHQRLIKQWCRSDHSVLENKIHSLSMSPIDWILESLWRDVSELIAFIGFTVKQLWIKYKK